MLGQRNRSGFYTEFHARQRTGAYKQLIAKGREILSLRLCVASSPSFPPPSLPPWPRPRQTTCVARLRALSVHNDRGTHTSAPSGFTSAPGVTARGVL